MTVKLTIRGLPELQRKLGNLQNLKTGLRPAMQRSCETIRSAMAKYPPPASGLYRRTGTLGRRWTTKVISGLRGIVENVTRYAPWVQHYKMQARVHQGRWQTDEEIVKKKADSILREFEQEIAKLMK